MEALQARGHQILHARSLVESHRILARQSPDLVILLPLALRQQGVELELLEGLQHNRPPVPVILLGEGPEAMDAAKNSDLPLLDFMLAPYEDAELLRRVELNLLNSNSFHAIYQRAQELEGQVSIDFKTGLISERHFRSILSREFQRAQRHHDPLAFMLVDVDDFKSINDSTEYAFGDRVLQDVAKSLQQTIRGTDYAARFGGDEFALLLPHTTPAEAVQTAMRVRRNIASRSVEDQGYQKQVTVSIGIGTFDGRSHMSLEEQRSQANKALQQAKRRGKNQVWLFSPEQGDSQPAEAGQG